MILLEKRWTLDNLILQQRIKSQKQTGTIQQQGQKLVRQHKELL